MNRPIKQPAPRLHTAPSLLCGAAAVAIVVIMISTDEGNEGGEGGREKKGLGEREREGVQIC